MPRARSFHRLFGASFLILGVLLVGVSTAAEPTVTKLFSVDANGSDLFLEITNTGTINAENRLFSNTQMSLEAKTTAMTAVFNGALASGMLVATTPVVGDFFFALDPDTNAPIVIEIQETSFVLPSGSTSFTRWSLPGGLR